MNSHMMNSNRLSSNSFNECSNKSPMELSRSTLISLFVIMTLARLILAYFFPITGDEAYFYRWGQYVDTVYYDHPGLIGWWMWLSQWMGHHIFFPRLLEVGVGGFIAWGIYSIVKELSSKPLAIVASLLYYTTPMSLMSILISTDTPLVLFVFLSGWFFLRSYKHNETASYLASAIALGLAFWSKYLMFFMVWGLLLAAFLCLKPLRKKITYVLILAFIGLFFIVTHFYWSYQNCWWSVLFNFFNRDSETQFKFKNILTYIGFLFYLTTPWLFYWILKRAKQLTFLQNLPLKAAWILYAIPLILLGLPSSTYPNLHWPLSYIPFVFIAISAFENLPYHKFIRYNLVFSALHFLFFIVILSLPDSVFSSNKFYRDIIMGRYGYEIEHSLEKYKDRYIFGTIGYTTSGLMHYHNQHPYLVFKDLDNNGRCDDKWTDYRVLDGKDILLISTYKYRPEEELEYKNYFQEIVYEEINVRGATFYIARGHAFKFQKFKEGYLTWVKNTYYRMPSYLPQGPCFFFDRYFPELSDKGTLHE